MNTENTICWLKQGAEHNLIASLPKSSDLSRLFYEKSKLHPDQVEERLVLDDDRCLAERDPKIVYLLKGDGGSTSLIMGISRQEGKPLASHYGIVSATNFAPQFHSERLVPNAYSEFR